MEDNKIKDPAAVDHGASDLFRAVIWIKSQRLNVKLLLYLSTGILWNCVPEVQNIFCFHEYPCHKPRMHEDLCVCCVILIQNRFLFCYLKWLFVWFMRHCVRHS